MLSSVYVSIETTTVSFKSSESWLNLKNFEYNTMCNSDCNKVTGKLLYALSKQRHRCLFGWTQWMVWSHSFKKNEYYSLKSSKKLFLSVWFRTRFYIWKDLFSIFNAWTNFWMPFLHTCTFHFCKKLSIMVHSQCSFYSKVNKTEKDKSCISIGKAVRYCFTLKQIFL